MLSAMNTNTLLILGIGIIVIAGLVLWNPVAPPTTNPTTPPVNPPVTPPVIPPTTPPADEFPPVPSDVTYEFGAKFEPPVGRIVHGMGQWDEYNTKYVNALGEANAPASELIFVQIGDSMRPWDAAKIKQTVMEIDAKGEIPNLNISLQGNQLTKEQIDKLPDPYYGIDDDVASGTKYDSRLQDLVKIAKDYKKPFMVRIGGEFNGWWNGYKPYAYPKAYRKIVQMFRDAGADNVAFIWCYEPSGPNDFDEKDSSGNYKWFPGNDMIDWYSVDLFANTDVSGPEKTSNGTLTSFGKVIRFLDMAETAKKPVIIAESAPSQVDINPAANGTTIWNTWFKPYFALMKEYPIIKWFHYINYDWTKASYYASTGWKNSDITNNSVVTATYITEMEKPEYIHSDERYLLNDYLKYK